jgi:CheY-like chemotaxis protein/CRP-like cAMP-binding protein
MKQKILIIEDNDDVRENLSEILVLSGYETVTASHGKLGVRAALDHTPDLILCDIMMPELDGYGVLRILSRNPATANIPFIFLTAKTEMVDMRRGMALGADDYITKPFDDVELLNTLEVRLQKKRSTIRHDAESMMMNVMTAQQVLESFPPTWSEAEPRRVVRKDILYAEGQVCRHVYIIVSGRAFATKVDDYSKEVITQVLQAPQVIGVASAFAGDRFQETIKALDDLEVLPVKREEFIAFVLQDKQLCYHYLTALATGVVRAEEKLLLQAYSPVRMKLADVLLDLYEAFAVGDKAVIPVQREDLASMAGTAKETIIRTLSEFKEEGLVRIAGTDIIVEDVQLLKELRY